MNSLAFISPVLPGQADHFRQFAREIGGPRKKDMTESRRAKHVTREITWIRPTPMGDLLLVYLEGDDVLEANREFARSQTPLDLWFKDQARAVIGIDFSQPLPDNLAEVLFETPIVDHKPSLAVALPVASGKTEDLRRWAKDQYGSRRVGGCQSGSPPEVWLKNDLVAHPNACTHAYWHQPRFSSGQ